MFKFSQNSFGLLAKEFDYVDRRVTKSIMGNYYSPSFISNWNSCPAMTLLYAISPYQFAPALAVGSATHYILEKRFSGKDVDEEHLSNIVNGDEKLLNQAREYASSYDKIKDDFPESKHFTEKVIESDNLEPLGVKLPTIKGIIDRIDISDKKTRIIDYKTSSSPIESDKYIDQLTIYKWLVEFELGLVASDVCVFSLYVKDPKILCPNITLKSQSELIEKIVKTDKEVKESFNTGKYAKKPGYKCKFCKWSGMCFSNNDIEVE